MSQSVNGKILAMGLRRVAKEMEGLPPGDDIAIRRYRLIDQAGRLIIDAVQRGFLQQLSGLPALVAWAKGDAQHPTAANAEGSPSSSKAQAVLSRCPANVFNELRGNHLVAVQMQGSSPLVAKETHGGILPPLYDGLLPAEQADKAPTAEPDVRTCLAIAEMIEADGSVRDEWVTANFLDRFTTLPSGSKTIRSAISKGAKIATKQEPGGPMLYYLPDIEAIYGRVVKRNQ